MKTRAAVAFEAKRPLEVVEPDLDGAVVRTAKVEPGTNAIVFGLGDIGFNVIHGLRMVGADRIVGVDLNPSKEEWGRRFGMTHFVNPLEIEGELIPHLVALTDLVHERQDRDRPDDHACADARRDQPRVRPDAQRREHPQRRRLLRREECTVT